MIVSVAVSRCLRPCSTKRWASTSQRLLTAASMQPSVSNPQHDNIVENASSESLGKAECMHNFYICTAPYQITINI